MNNALFLMANYVEGSVVEASSENGTAPASRVQNNQRSQIWRSEFGESSYLNVTMPRQRAVSYVAVVDTNLTSTGSIHVEAWDDDFEGSVQTVDLTVTPLLYSDPAEPGLPYGQGAFGAGPFGAVSSFGVVNARNITLIPIPAGVQSQFWRVTFSDINTSYQSCGVLYIGTHRTFTYNASYGWTQTRVERSVSREALGGQLYTQPRAGRRQIEGKFSYLTDAERTSMEIGLQQFGEFRPLMFSLYPEASDQGLTTTIYGRLSGVSQSGSSLDINELSFRIIEDL